MTSDLPTPDHCIEMLKSAGCHSSVITHCKAVRDVALLITDHIPQANRQLIEVGALLHDIGRAKTHDITHAIEGVRIARTLGLPEPVIQIIAHHMGAGILPDEAEKLGLPREDYTPRTLEEKIVAHADNLIDKGHKQPIANEVKKALKRNKKQLALRLLMLHQELSMLAGIDLDDVS